MENCQPVDPQSTWDAALFTRKVAKSPGNIADAASKGACQYEAITVRAPPGEEKRRKLVPT